MKSRTRPFKHASYVFRSCQSLGLLGLFVNRWIYHQLSQPALHEAAPITPCVDGARVLLFSFRGCGRPATSVFENALLLFRLVELACECTYSEAIRWMIWLGGTWVHLTMTVSSSERCA